MNFHSILSCIHFNPTYGYVYSWTNDRLWRKNRNSNAQQNRVVRHEGYDNDCFGVDLNRNYDVQWMYGGTSSNICDSTYGGTGRVLLFSLKNIRFLELY